MSGFTVEVDRRNDTRVVVTTTGELDLAVANHLWVTLEPLLTPAVVVALDCSGLTFVDSGGLRILLQARNVAIREGAALRLADPHPAVQRVLVLAGVEKIVDTYPSVEDAFSA